MARITGNAGLALLGGLALLAVGLAFWKPTGGTWDETGQVVALFVCVALSLAARSVAGSWFHPAATTAGAWTFFLAGATLSRLDRAPFTAWMVLLVVLGAVLASPVHVRAGDARSWAVEVDRPVRWLVLLGTAGGALAALLVLRANGVPMTALTSIEGIEAASRHITTLRYSSSLSNPAASTLLLGFTYGAALAAPYAAAGARGLWKVLLLAGPSLGGAVYAVATTARAGMLIAVMITAGSWLVVTGLTGGGRARLSPRALLGLVAAACAVAFAFLYVAVSRMGGWRPGAGAELVDKASVYAAGGVVGFQKWADAGIPARTPGFGSETFAGISQFLLGDIGGAYEEVVTIGPGLTTNVYTILRPLTEDFGIGGAVLFVAAGTFAAAAAYRRAAVAGSVAASIVAAVWSGLMLFSLATSHLTFTNVCFGLVVAAALLVRYARLEAGTEGGVLGSKVPDLGAEVGKKGKKRDELLRGHGAPIMRSRSR